MEKIAKENKKNNKTLDQDSIKNKFQAISFQELYGLFKVIKGVQYAKDFSTDVQKKAINDTYEQFLATIDP